MVEGKWRDQDRELGANASGRRWPEWATTISSSCGRKLLRWDNDGRRQMVEAQVVARRPSNGQWVAERRALFSHRKQGGRRRKEEERRKEKGKKEKEKKNIRKKRK